MAFLRSRPCAAALALAVLLAPWTSHAYVYDHDLSIDASDLSFSKETFVIGDTVRIYATVHDAGKSDMEGYVTFYQGSVPLGDSQVVSLRANGLPDQVFVDFTVPPSAFNIRAVIHGTDPPDENLSNNEAISPLITPVAPPPPPPPPPPAPTQVRPASALTPAPAPVPARKPVAKPKTASAPAAPMPPASPAPASAPASVAAAAPQPAAGEAAPPSDAPDAAFSYARSSWNAYAFSATAPDEPGRLFAWDFGDGATSAGRQATHVFHRAGTYAVKLTATNASGHAATQASTVRIPFFDWHNPLVMGLVGALGALGISGATAAVRAGGRRTVPLPAGAAEADGGQDDEDEPEGTDEA